MYPTISRLNGRRLQQPEIDVDPAVIGSAAWYDWLECHKSASAETLKPLIRSKISQPRTCNDAIRRPRLIEHLNAGLSGKVTLLSAPAGFGKTTLLVEWLKTSGRHGAWLTLDDNDNELCAFVHYLIGAFSTVLPDGFRTTCGLLKAAAFPPPERVATLLTNDLAALADDVILVLDNYHSIHLNEIHRLLDLLIRYMPPQVHLMLSTRSEPTFPLAKWRTQGQLNVLYGTSLRFTHNETEAFLTRVLGGQPPNEVTEILEEQTEGWIAMVRLAALSLQGASDYATFVERLRCHPDYYVNSYLMEDSLARQTPVVQNFLISASILDQFCASLCEATIAGDDAAHPYTKQVYLNWLERMKVFIVPLDERPGWYRFHPLFKIFLEQRLQERVTKEEIATLHLRASAWFVAQGLIDEAIGHALLAGDPTKAARLVEAQLLRAVESEQWAQLEHWLQLLPEEQIQSSPALLAARAWILEVRGQMEGVPPLLTAAEQLLGIRGNDTTNANDAQCQSMHAVIKLLWSFFQYATGQAQSSLESTLSAMQWIASGNVYVANLALQSLALSSQLTGQAVAANLELNNALKEETSNLPGSAHLLFAKALISLNAGKLQQLEQIAEHLLRLSEEANLPISQYRAHWLLGCVQYEWNRLDAAEYHFSKVVANRQYAHHWVVREAMYGLAFVYSAQGLSNQAKETTDTLLESLRERNNICALLGAYSFLGHLALLQDRVESAEQWIEMVGEPAVRGPITSFETPPITKARWLLARGDEHSIVQGQALLSSLLCHVESIHNTPKMIQVLALQALAYDLQGHTTEALEALEHSIVLAFPGGFIRTFADLPQLVKLLQELRKRRKALQTNERQLDAYLQSLLVAMSSMGLPATSKEELMWQEGLEPLTERELQILRLLGKNLTNKEIAHTLVITAGTVKVHTINVYRKLSVSNRRAAVALSRSLGLLTVMDP